MLKMFVRFKKAKAKQAEGDEKMKARQEEVEEKIEGKRDEEKGKTAEPEDEKKEKGEDRDAKFNAVSKAGGTGGEIMRVEDEKMGALEKEHSELVALIHEDMAQLAQLPESRAEIEAEFQAKLLEHIAQLPDTQLEEKVCQQGIKETMKAALAKTKAAFKAKVAKMKAEEEEEREER
jgi:hypothetical protein